MSFWYLATPYSKYSGGIEAAHAEACRQAALLVRAGVPVYSPIAHTHPIAIHGDINPFDHGIWLEADRAFMDAAKGLIVCKMEAWKESYGIKCEMEHFAAAGKPTVFMEPGLVPLEVQPTGKRIIGLMGYAKSGKDTAAAALVADGWTRVAFADAVRDAAWALNPRITWRTGDSAFQKQYHYEGSSVDLQWIVNGEGWDEAKRVMDIRELLQKLGTEAGRDIHGPDCWIKIAARKVEDSLSSVVITDVRFQNEADAIRFWGGKIVRIDRPGIGPVNDHASERLDIEPDQVVTNDGSIDDLHSAIREIATGNADFAELGGHIEGEGQ